MTISRVAVKDENELQKIVVSDISVVERGLTVVCNNMPMDAKTNLDVLCHDEYGQLVILKASTKENDNMFFEGLKILTYVNNVKPLLKFSYKDFKISETKMPRLIFLAPSFSAQLVDVVGQMQGIQMDLYKWEYFEFNDTKALHLEPVWLSEATKGKPQKPKAEKSRPAKAVEEPEAAPETTTEEVFMPPLADEAPEVDDSDRKEKGKRKSIFSI